MLQDLCLYEYCLDFDKPQLVNNKLLSQRKGIILSSFEKLSEAAPLPGYSQEDLIYVENELKELGQSFSSIEELTIFLQESSLSNSSKFALFSLFLPQSPSDRNDFILKGRSYIDVPSFYPYWESEVLKKIKMNLKNQNPYIKIKMSSYSLNESLNILSKIKKHFSNQVQLHLDFNQRLSLCEAIEFMNNSSTSDFYLIEDPVKSLEDLDILSQKSSFPLAVDNLLREYDWKDLKKLNNLKCMMIKPTLSMDLLLDRHFIEFIKQGSLQIDLSSSYESCIGLNCIKKLGFYLFKQFSVGIDTLGLFKNSFYSNEKIDYSLLKKL